MALAALLQADPRVSNIAKQIRAQQRIVAPRGIVIPDEYIDEMAVAFVRVFGVDDVRQIRPHWIDQTYSGEGGDRIQYAYTFEPNGVTLPVDGTADDDNNVYFWTSANGKLTFLFRWVNALDVPIFAVTQTLYKGFLQDIAPFVAIIAAMVGLPTMIGEAVLGAETAAAYPVVSNAVGKAALQLALTGGDIEKSLIGAVATVGGAEVGGFVGSAVDSAAIGQVTQAATAAAIQGKDAGKAATRAALFAAAGGMMDDEQVEVSLEELGIDPGTLATLDIQAQNELVAYGFTGNELFSDPDGNLFYISGEAIALSDAAFARGYYPDSRGNIRDPANRIVATADQVAGKSVDEINAILVDDMQVNQGKVVSTQPGDPARPASLPQTAAQTKIPTITDQAKVADALFKTAASISNSIRTIVTGKPLPYATSAYGTTRPQVPGVPFTRADGSVVTNNGNGTQTIRYPDGRVQTVSTAYTSGGYGSLIPGVSNQTLLIGGAIVLGALLLARRRSA